MHLGLQEIKKSLQTYFYVQRYGFQNSAKQPEEMAMYQPEPEKEGVVPFETVTLSSPRFSSSTDSPKVSLTQGVTA